MNEKLIKESSLEEFEFWMKEYQKNKYGPYDTELLDFFNKNYKEIKKEPEKLNHIFTILGVRRGEKQVDLLRNACFNLHEYIVEQLLIRGWSSNASYNGSMRYAPIREVILPNSAYIKKEDTKPKQKKMLLLLIQYGLSLDFMKTDSFGQSIHDLIQEKEIHYIYDWIDSYHEHFNEKQRKEWNSFRLQRLF